MSHELARSILEYYARGHPLAAGIPKSEVPQLADALRLRLHAEPSRLNLAPESLGELVTLLKDYARASTTSVTSPGELHEIAIAREIAGYLGAVIMGHRGGEWENPGSLLEVGVTIAGRSTATKGGELRSYPKTVINVGHFAAGIWEAVLLGLSPDIVRLYKAATATRGMEIL